MKSPHQESIESEKPELRIKGRAVSRGIAVGKIVCLYGRSRQFYRRRISRRNIQGEIERFDAALAEALAQIEELISRASAAGRRSARDILQAHSLILSDPELLMMIRTTIANRAINAEVAVNGVIEEISAEYKSLPDEGLRQKYVDVEDVGERLQFALAGTAATGFKMPAQAIIAAVELRPSTLLDLASSRISALITDRGGWTSHTSILAREMGLPAVTGVSNIFRRVADGDRAIVDGYAGTVVVRPSATTARARHSRRSPGANTVAASPRGGPCKTLDGREIFILANADSPAAYAKAKLSGASGVGLYRSEYLFSRSKGFPSESDQTAAYRAIADAASGAPVKIRTFDLNCDEVLQNARGEKNPALGLRAIRLGLAQRPQLQTQLRALLAASAESSIDIILPMISSVSEILIVRRILARERSRLKRERKLVGNPRLGVMIEVPAAIITINAILSHCDCISLGTNDLVQYLLAVDRDNEAVADLFRSLHPAVLASIKTTVRATEAAGKELLICGEMAGSPYYTPLLVGLGARALSMNAGSVTAVRTVIGGIAYEEARSLANECLKSETADQVEALVERCIIDNWRPFYPEHFSTGLRATAES